jgi:competence protein ComEA
VKQNPLPARFRCTLTAVAIIAVVFASSACVTLPRSTLAPRVAPEKHTTNGTSAININTALQVELERLPGIGAGLAERIIAHRQQYGPFRRPEQLMMVRGISDRKFRELRSMIVVQ